MMVSTNSLTSSISKTVAVNPKVTLTLPRSQPCCYRSDSENCTRSAPHSAAFFTLRNSTVYGSASRCLYKTYSPMFLARLAAELALHPERPNRRIGDMHKRSKNAQRK